MKFPVFDHFAGNLQINSILFKKWYEISNLKNEGHLFEMIIAEISQETGFLLVIGIVIA